MALSDDHLDTTSRKLLDEIEEMKRLELDKRYEPRGTEEFHALAAQVEQRARHVLELAKSERLGADEDSPIGSERQEQQPGDWVDGRPT